MGEFDSTFPLRKLLHVLLADLCKVQAVYRGF